MLSNRKTEKWMPAVTFVIALTWMKCMPQRTSAYPASSNSLRDLDICNHWNGRRHFLELGERGELHARNVTTTNTIYRSGPSLFSANANSNNNNSRSSGDVSNRRNHFNARNDIWYQQCNLELVTCAECVIRITFTHLNFSRNCERSRSTGTDNSDSSNGQLSACPCDYIQFSEPPYESISTHQFCGDGKIFRTKTRTLLLKFFYRGSAGHAFSLQYYSERNVQIISGSPKQSILSSHSNSGRPPLPAHIISTPFFPLTYPRDYVVENILTCEAENCHVRLDFSDFQLGLQSTMEIFDSNSQMLDTYTGEHFRPPITTSSGKSLLLVFHGNGGSGVGFRAEVSFVSTKPLKTDQLVPYTDCGGLVTGAGGAITMMNMSSNSTDLRLYDCIWLIKPGNNYMMMKTHIALRVQEFSGLASRSELTIRQGTTSESLLLECLKWPPSGPGGSTEDKEGHVVPVLDGYYIRLRGVFGMSSKLAIVYSVFNYMNCYIGSEFLCSNNNRCISIRLHCDGFDHCGDNSDEPDSCEADWAHLHNDRRWYSHKPNFYFPKIEQYPDLKTATGIFIISTLGIFAVLSGWMVILYRMGVRARQQRELQSHLQTISEFLEDRQDELPPDEPPGYEAPPDYEEVIKVGMEQELREPRCRRQGRGHRHHNHNRHRDRSCSRAGSSITLQSIVPIHNSNEMDGHNAGTNDANAAADQNMQSLSNRVLMATNACGPSCSFPASTSAAAAAAAAAATSTSMRPTTLNQRESPTDGSGCCAYRSVGVATSPLSPLSSMGCELPAPATERSEEFHDDSLNISFSLAMPTTDCLTSASSAATLTTTNNSNGNNINSNSNNNNNSNSNSSSNNNIEAIHSRNGNNCTEQTYLKRSWIVVNTSGAHTYKMQRLRHTFSSPESFQVGDHLGADFMGYGTNLPQERNFFPSNISNCGSELPRDFSAQSFALPSPAITSPQPICSCTCQLHHGGNKNKKLTTCTNDGTLQNSNIGSCGNGSGNGSLSEVENSADRHLLLLEMDSDGENREVSCFGAVNKPQFRIGGNRVARNAHVWRRHVRSKSLTNSTALNHQQLQQQPQPQQQQQQQQQSRDQRQRNISTVRVMQRSSSADLLTCASATPKRDIRDDGSGSGTSSGARLFLI